MSDYPSHSVYKLTNIWNMKKDEKEIMIIMVILNVLQKNVNALLKQNLDKPKWQQ